MRNPTRIFFGVTLSALSLIGIQLLRLYRQPLGPALELPTATRGAQPTVTLFPTLTQVSFSPVPTDIPATTTSTPQPFPPLLALFDFPLQVNNKPIQCRSQFV